MVTFPNIFAEAVRRMNELEAAFTAFGKQLLHNEHFTDWLLAFNQDDMLEGKRPDKTEITKTPQPWQYSNKYEPVTKEIKKGKGQVYDKVTLQDTGAFYKGMKVNAAASNQLRIESTDPKTDQIIAVWGLVLGVSEDNLQQFIEIIRPEFFRFAEDYWKH